MSAPSIEDFANQFISVKGWSAKNQVCCKVAKIHHRAGLKKFADLVGWDLKKLEKAYAIRTTLQKKNRKRRGQKPIKRKTTACYSTEEIVPAVLANWYKRSLFER